LIGITSGRKGAVFFDGASIHQIEASIILSVDTTGAGDAYQDGLIYGLINKWSVLMSDN